MQEVFRRIFNGGLLKMAYNYEWPYVDPTRYNADWLINEMRRLREEWKAFRDKMEQEWADFQAAIRKEMDDFKDEMRARQGQFETEMRNAWADYQAQLNAAWTAFQGAMRKEWADWKNQTTAELEAWKTSTENGLNAWKTATETRFQALYDSFTSEMTTSFNVFKDVVNASVAGLTGRVNAVETAMSNMRSDWASFQNSMTTSWNNYQSTLNQEWGAYQASMDTQFNNFKAEINNYLDSIDVQGYVDTKIEQMYGDGYFDDIGLSGTGLKASITHEVPWNYKNGDTIAMCGFDKNIVVVSGRTQDFFDPRLKTRSTVELEKSMSNISGLFSTVQYYGAEYDSSVTPPTNNLTRIGQDGSRTVMLSNVGVSFFSGTPMSGGWYVTSYTNAYGGIGCFETSNIKGRFGMHLSDFKPVIPNTNSRIALMISKSGKTILFANIVPLPETVEVWIDGLGKDEIIKDADIKNSSLAVLTNKRILVCSMNGSVENMERFMNSYVYADFARFLPAGFPVVSHLNYEGHNFVKKIQLPGPLPLGSQAVEVSILVGGNTTAVIVPYGQASRANVIFLNAFKSAPSIPISCTFDIDVAYSSSAGNRYISLAYSVYSLTTTGVVRETEDVFFSDSSVFQEKGPSYIGIEYVKVLS